MKSKKEKFLSIILILTLVVSIGFSGIIFGCKAEEVAAPAEEEVAAPAEEEVEEVIEEKEPVTIEWVQWFEGSSKEGTIEALISEFEAEYPNIKVEAVNLPFGEVRNQVITNVAAGNVPDVIGMNPPWMAEFVELGVLEPLEDYIANDPNLNASELHQAPMAKYQGHTWMVPYTVSTFVLFYNQTLFTEAGLDGTPTNWAEIREYAQLLTDVDKGQYGFTMFMNEQPPTNGSIVIMYPFIYAAGGKTIVDGVPSVKDPAILETVQLLADLHEDGSVIPGTTSKPEVQMVEEFANGNIAMMVENTAHIGTLANRNPDLDYGLVVIPSIDGSHDPVLRHHGWELGMSASSEHKEEAWTFISWLVSKEPNSKIAQDSSNIPGNLAADVSFYDDVPQLVQAIDIIANYEMLEELMVTPKATARWQALTIETLKMLSGEQTPEDVIVNTQTAWDEID